MPGLVEFLDQLCISGIRVGLATSASKHRTLHTLEQLRIAHYFETVVTGDDVAAGKPDPAVYRLAASRMQELPEHLLAVEDAVSGVKAARTGGFRWATIPPERRPDSPGKR